MGSLDKIARTGEKDSKIALKKKVLAFTLEVENYICFFSHISLSYHEIIISANYFTSNILSP